MKKREQMYSHFMVVLPMGLGRDLQRLCNGVEAKVERKISGGSTEASQPLTLGTHIHRKKNRISALLCNSSPVTLQVIVTLDITAVIHFVPLVTHSSPSSGISIWYKATCKGNSLITYFWVTSGERVNCACNIHIINKIHGFRRWVGWRVV